ncbi:sulfotransferase [Methylocucumis oryzae]|uniref:Sulfotransferase n=1 Tax=Methylocucumis oryzae TaxID=1632867 RepID=A0A0F3IL15_9GAMM|nr:hypothetical protein VZ94_12550 [Methylocucumis oryzae]
MENHQLIFICGALRSGSTMLRLMLDHHPNIVNPGEFDFLFDYMYEDGSFPSTDKLLRVAKTQSHF